LERIGLQTFGDASFDPMPGVKKIAVVRANGLGDLIFALPALDALRAAYPDAEIVYLGKAWHAAFLQGRPGPMDRTVVVPPYGGVGEQPGFPEDPEAIEAFFQTMRAEHFDLAFQIHGGGRYSNPFTRCLEARLTIGLKTPDAEALDRWVPYIYFQREMLRYLEVVSLAGATPVTLDPRVAVTAADREEASMVVRESGRPLVVMHPGASDPQRRWPAEKFAAVGDALVEAGAEIAVTGTGSERPVVEAVLDAMHHPAHNLHERLSIGGFAGLLARCAVVVSNDSGPLHLAAAVGASTVGIFWCFNHINAAPLTRARHRPLISWRLACPICGATEPRQHCHHQESFVADISVEEVSSAALDLLAMPLRVPA
jgi:ADP-heptose:LPS heptosyltransferase